MRANIRGPISSLSWNAKTKSVQLGLLTTRCEPDDLFNFQPFRIKAHIRVWPCCSAIDSCRSKSNLDRLNKAFAVFQTLSYDT